MPPWSAHQHFFEWDGSYRDICVIGVGLQGWDALLRIARASPSSFSIDGEPRPLPASAPEALALQLTCCPLLSIDWDGIVLNAHFFDSEDVELDLDPRAVASAGAFKALMRFLSLLADETGRPVLLTPESSPDKPYLEVRPGDRVIVCEPA